MFLVSQIFAAVLIGPVVNSIFAFGEEFGWRAYLLPKLLPLGFRKAVLIVGVIWGVWHWPLIAMGYEYGSGYSGAPWVGMPLFLWFTLAVGIFFGWLVVRARSVWPTVIAHATLNGAAKLPLLFYVGGHSVLLGPLAVGILGSAGFAAVGLLILWRWDAAKATQQSDSPA